MDLIAYLLFVVLLLVALAHLGWAFGMAWPAATRAKLGAMVIGSPKGVRLPSMALTVIVAGLIFGLGLAALWGSGVFSLGGLDGLRRWIIAAITVVFWLRGLATYLPFGPLHTRVEPFRTLDLRYFAPLCLLLSAGYLAIFLSL